MPVESLEMAPTQEQLEGWRRAAGDRPLGVWLAELADAAALEAGVEPAAPRAWPVTIKLSTPVANGAHHVTELVLRKGTAKILKGLKLPARATDDWSVDLFLKVAARLAGEPDHVIDALAPEDLNQVIEVASDFLSLAVGGGKRR